MIDSKNQTVKPIAAPMKWVQPPASLSQAFADEALLQYIGDHCYLTFGQIQAPIIDPSTPPDEIIVAPVARVAITPATFHKVLSMLQRMADRIPNTVADPSKGD